MLSLALTIFRKLYRLPLTVTPRGSAVRVRQRTTCFVCAHMLTVSALADSCCCAVCYIHTDILTNLTLVMYTKCLANLCNKFVSVLTEQNAEEGHECITNTQ